MKNKGITLVALVITIIILLILAGISIQAITNTGIFAQVEEAKKRTENAQKEEDEILKNYLEQMNAIIGGQVTESVPDGAVVTPINDITTWLKTAGISKQYSYTTIEQVIADSTCTKSLMNNENAMKYLARSTEFADAICASETTMTSLGQSTYVDNTVLNSDNWKQAIKASQYWALVYDSKTVTVYGAASEIITIEGYYNASFTTGTDGSCSHVVPIDTITLTGSVSGKSFVRTITNETTAVYAMPEGALYWYGNECEWITGGWADDGFVRSSNSYYQKQGTPIKNTNNISLVCNDSSSLYGYYSAINTKNSLSVSNTEYTKAFIKAKDSRTGKGDEFNVRFVNVNTYTSLDIVNRGNYPYISISRNTETTASADLDLDGNYKFGAYLFCGGGETMNGTSILYALWLE